MTSFREGRIPFPNFLEFQLPKFDLCGCAERISTGMHSDFDVRIYYVQPITTMLHKHESMDTVQAETLSYK